MGSNLLFKFFSKFTYSFSKLDRLKKYSIYQSSLKWPIWQKILANLLQISLMPIVIFQIRIYNLYIAIMVIVMMKIFFIADVKCV